MSNIHETPEKDLSAKAAEIKAKYNATVVHAIETMDEDGKEYTAWIRKPNIDQIGAYASMVGNNPVRASQVLLNTVWLEGDEIMRTEEELLLGVISQLDKIIKVRVARVKKY